MITRQCAILPECHVRIRFTSIGGEAIISRQRVVAKISAILQLRQGSIDKEYSKHRRSVGRKLTLQSFELCF